MRNVSLTLVSFTVILLTVNILCSLITLSVKDDELNSAIDYAAELTIDSLSNKYINGANVTPNKSYIEVYHYNEAIEDSINELRAGNIINDETAEYIINKSYMSVTQILDDTSLNDKIYDDFTDDFANIVLEKVFTYILMDCKDSNAVYEIEFYNVDAANGVIDVEVTQTSMYNAFKKCSTTARRTVFKETYSK